MPSNGDPSAIHWSHADEFKNAAEKSTPIGDDEILLEDSEDSKKKKRAKLSSLPGGASALDDLSDVDTSGVQDGDALVYDSGTWVPGGVGASYAETIGDNTNTSYQVTHGLGTEDLVVQLWDLTGSDPVEATGDADSITIDDEDNITVVFSAPPATDSYRVVVLSSGGSSGGGGGTGWRDRIILRQDTAHAQDDEFNDDTVDDAWDVVEDSSPNITVNEGGDVMSIFHPGGDSSGEFHGIVRPWSPSGDFVIETAIRIAGVAQNYQMAGLVAADGDTYGAGGQMIAYYNATNANVELASFTNWNSRGSLQFRSSRFGPFPWLHLRLEYEASTGVWVARFSPDGVSWVDVVPISRSLTISHVGLAVSTYGGSNPQVFTFEYFRVFE